MKCKYCHRTFDTIPSLGGHTKNCKNNPKHEIFKIESFNRRKSGKYSNVDYGKGMRGKKLMPETKEKLSKKRKNYLAETKNHNWNKYKKVESNPEKVFREILESSSINENFYQYYIPEESFRFFELDFAVPNIKLAFEINGNQHYENGKLKKYYLERHNYFVGLGWTLIEIPYHICYNEKLIKSIIANSINGNIQFSNGIINKAINHRIERIKNKEKIKKYKLKVKNEEKLNKEKENTEIIKYKINLILKSDINYKKFGWVNKASSLIGISSQKLGYWMKKNIPEFYSNCYIRKH